MHAGCLGGSDKCTPSMTINFVTLACHAETQFIHRKCGYIGNNTQHIYHNDWTSLFRHFWQSTIKASTTIKHVYPSTISYLISYIWTTFFCWLDSPVEINMIKTIWRSTCLGKQNGEIPGQCHPRKNFLFLVTKIIPICYRNVHIGLI